MLRTALRSIIKTSSAGTSMTEIDVIQQCQTVPASSVVPEQASSLITSTTKRAEKRKTESASVHQTSSKRTKSHAYNEQSAPCSTDVSNDDQENQQTVVGASSPEHANRGVRSSLGTMFAPLYALLHQGGHEQAAAAAYGGASAAAAVIATAAAAGQPEGGRQQQGCAAPCSEQPQQLTGEASASADTSGATCSSTPTVSQPSTAGYAARAHHAHSHSHHDHSHQQFLQQEEELYHPHEHTAQHSHQLAVLQQQYSSSGSDESDDYDEDDFDPLVFIGTLGPVEHYAMPGRQPLLPKQTRTCKQKTLVLDLDETLVHSTLDAACGIGADFSFPVTFNGAEHMVHVRQRPHMLKFLERVAALFEVVVFTASQKVYAEKLLNILDPQRQLIRHRIYRDSCVLVDGNYLKDLSVLGRDLSRCAIVDNSPQAFGFQVANGIPIESWYDDPEDNELMLLLPFLEEIACTTVEDVRPAITLRYNLPAKVQEASMRLMNSVAAAAAQQQQMARAAAAAAVLQPQQLVQQLAPPCSQAQMQQA